MMTYFTCNASAITPAAIGAAALVPVNESVHLLLVNIVAYQLLIFSLQQYTLTIAFLRGLHNF